MEILFLFGLIILLLLLGTPIGVSLGLSSILFLLIYSDSSLASVTGTFFNAMSGHYTLLAIPFFILASSFMSTGGAAKRIIRFANASVGHLRGGLGMASVMACMLFAALSGSSPATVVAVGSIAISAMREQGYTKEFAAGIITNAGTLGILIPPSIVMVVYGSATDVSIGRLFMAGIIPGLLIGFALMLAIYLAAVAKKMPKGRFVGWGEFFGAMLDSSWGLFLIIIILGGIYGGVFTPTESAAIASVYSIFVALFIYRDMGPLAGKPWIREAERAQALLGAYVVGFILATVLLYLVGGSLALIKLKWDLKAGMHFLYMASVLFSVFCLVLGWIYAVTAKKSYQRLVTTGVFLVFGILPALWIGSQILGLGDRTWAIRILLALLAAIAWCIPLAMMLYAYTKAAQSLNDVGGRYRYSLYLGARNILRGLGDIVISFIPTFFSHASRKTFFEAARLTIMLMFIIANALILKHVLTDERIPQQITAMMLDAHFDRVMFLLLVNVLLLIGGQFMEPSGLIVIVAPLVFPIAMALGVDPVHLGVIMVVNMEIGMLTPPVGLNLFVMSGVANMPVMRVVRASTPWMLILLGFLILLTYVPIISTWLPDQIYGPAITAE